MNLHLLHCVAGALFLFTLSCNHSNRQYRTIPPIGWTKQTVCRFDFTINQTDCPYNVILQIRNDNRYPYQNLWLLAREESPRGFIQQDTLQCFLANDLGKWRGQGISLFEVDIPLHTRYFFPHKGRYTLLFRHGMHNDTLPGIRQIGLTIQPVKYPFLSPASPSSLKGGEILQVLR